VYNASGTPKQKDGLVDKKLGRSLDISGFDAIVWGNLFESSAKIFTEVVMGCDIFDVNGSIIHTPLKNEYGEPINSDSPDGMGVVLIPKWMYNDYVLPIPVQNTDLYGKTRLGKDKKKFVKSFIYGNKPEKMPFLEPYTIPIDSGDELCLIAHFEFKNPISRKIDHEKISNDYLFQKLSGLDVFKLAKIGVFSEVKFSQVDKFRFDPIVLTDLCRTKSSHPCYFAMTKFLRLKDSAKSIQQYSNQCLNGLKFGQDYEIIDGPFMYYFGTGSGHEFEFVHNNFIAELKLDWFEHQIPTTLDEFNDLCTQLEDELLQSDHCPAFKIYHEVEEFSIKLIRKMPGFLDNFQPYCEEILERVRCQS
jgi:hypothetical protein